jgi:hypothetical protein
MSLLVAIGPAGSRPIVMHWHALMGQVVPMVEDGGIGGSNNGPHFGATERPSTGTYRSVPAHAQPLRMAMELTHSKRPAAGLAPLTARAVHHLL